MNNYRTTLYRNITSGRRHTPCAIDGGHVDVSAVLQQRGGDAESACGTALVQRRVAGVIADVDVKETGRNASLGQILQSIQHWSDVSH